MLAAKQEKNKKHLRVLRSFVVNLEKPTAPDTPKINMTHPEFKDGSCF
jgi:hypothetical protein